MNKFIYAYNEKDKDYLLGLSYFLISTSETNNGYIYTFENKECDGVPIDEFENRDILFGDTMTF